MSLLQAFRSASVNSHQPYPRYVYLAATLTLATIAGCATSVITPELEAELGNEMSQQVEQQIGLYEDAELTRYMQAVGQRLVDALDSTPYTFRFAIVDQAEPNAFASPGGYVYVSRSLLAQMNTEAELAGVLAHEISHVTQRHHARQVGRSVGTSLFTLPGRAVGVVSEGLGNVINAPIEAAGQVYLSSFSRGQETEADDYGMQLAARAGYEPLALADALEGIERAVEYQTGEKHKASYLDTHPTTPTRVADINQQAQTIVRRPSPPLASPQQLLAHLDGLWWGAQNPQQGIFHQQTYLNADLDFTITFAEGWKTVNTPRFVGASEPEGGALIALGGIGRATPPSELGDAVVAKMHKEANLAPAERRAFSIGQWPAEVIRYDDTSGEETVSIYYLFVAAPTQTFTLQALGLARHREALRETTLSLRQLTSSEKASIKGQRIHLTSSQQAATVTTLSQQSANEWPTGLTTIINGLEDKENVAAGRSIKILRTERYQP